LSGSCLTRCQRDELHSRQCFLSVRRRCLIRQQFSVLQYAPLLRAVGHSDPPLQRRHTLFLADRGPGRGLVHVPLWILLLSQPLSPSSTNVAEADLASLCGRAPQDQVMRHVGSASKREEASYRRGVIFHVAKTLAETVPAYRLRPAPLRPARAPPHQSRSNLEGCPQTGSRAARHRRIGCRLQRSQCVEVRPGRAYLQCWLRGCG
jgi:hypothetical protein